MDAAEWKFQNMSFYNYGSKEMKGSISILHASTETKIELKLLPEDLVRIFEVIQDRVIDSMNNASRHFFVQAGVPVRAFHPQVEPGQDGMGNSLDGTADPAFGGQKED